MLCKSAYNFHNLLNVFLSLLLQNNDVQHIHNNLEIFSCFFLFILEKKTAMFLSTLFVSCIADKVNSLQSLMLCILLRRMLMTINVFKYILIEFNETHQQSTFRFNSSLVGWSDIIIMLVEHCLYACYNSSLRPVAKWPKGFSKVKHFNDFPFFFVCFPFWIQQLLAVVFLTIQLSFFFFFVFPNFSSCNSHLCKFTLLSCFSLSLTCGPLVHTNELFSLVIRRSCVFFLSSLSVILSMCHWLPGKAFAYVYIYFHNGKIVFGNFSWYYTFIFFLCLTY